MAIWHVRAFAVFKVTDPCIACAEERVEVLPQTFPEMLHSVNVDEAQYQGGENTPCERHRDEEIEQE